MIYFITGDNYFAASGRVKALIANFVKEHSDLAVERLDGDESSETAILETTQSLPFLTPAKLVVIQNANDKILLEKLAELDILDSITVIVLIGKPDKRAKYYRKISKSANFETFEQKNINLPSWVIEYAKNNGGQISSSDARYLVERVGANQQLLSNEIDKLVMFNSKISHQSIDELTDLAPHSTIFQLIDATFAGRIKEAEALYKEQRMQKVEPQVIIGMLAWQLHLMALVKAAGNESADSIAREAKLNPFIVQKTKKLVANLTASDIKVIIKKAVELDKAIKTKSIDVDAVILVFLHDIKSQPR